VKVTSSAGGGPKRERSLFSPPGAVQPPTTPSHERALLASSLNLSLALSRFFMNWVSAAIRACHKPSDNPALSFLKFDGRC
jgi:hypothetical protein